MTKVAGFVDEIADSHLELAIERTYYAARTAALEALLRGGAAGALPYVRYLRGLTECRDGARFVAGRAERFKAFLFPPLQAPDAETEPPAGHGDFDTALVLLKTTYLAALQRAAPKRSALVTKALTLSQTCEDRARQSIRAALDGDAHGPRERIECRPTELHLKRIELFTSCARSLRGVSQQLDTQDAKAATLGTVEQELRDLCSFLKDNGECTPNDLLFEIKGLLFEVWLAGFCARVDKEVQDIDKATP